MPRTRPHCHPALLLDEILTRIFSILRERRLKRTLAAAAVTCQAWSVPALVQLWSEVVDVVNMLNVLSPVLYDGRKPVGRLLEV